MDYNKMRSDWAMRRQSVKGKRVLVVGCNSGLDCRYFAEARVTHHYLQCGFSLAHLRLSQEQALQHLIDNDIEIVPANGDRAEVANYMYDRANFNMTPSLNYLSELKR